MSETEALRIRVDALEAIAIALALELLRGDAGFRALYEPPRCLQGTIDGPRLSQLTDQEAFAQFGHLRDALGKG